MESDDRTHRLLEEIRDAQRDHLAETVGSRSGPWTFSSVPSTGSRSWADCRRVVVLGGGAIVVLMVLLLYLLVRWSHYLFR